MSSKSATSKKAEGINWATAIWISVFHLSAIAALFMFNWKALAATIALWWIAGSLGVGMGFHRLLTHRGYKTPKWVEYFLTVCGMLAFEGGPINWVVTHRIHHAYTDAEGDPHTPRDGKWWSHVGWVLRGTAQQHERKVLWRYAPDLMKDPFYRVLNTFYFVPLIICSILLLAFGGWPVLMWGIFFRITFNLHATWLVNSATHMWGSRRFATRDDSTNSWWVALLTFGEGWHNNHHAHPTAARHGLTWYEVDVNWWGIRTLKMLGLAKEIKLISKAAMAAAQPEEASPLRRAA